MNKKRKYAYAAMTSACLAIAVIIIINVIAYVVSDKISLSVDLTKDGILDFSEKTAEVVSGLDMDVHILSLIPANDKNREMVQIDEVLKKYDTMSDKITYERADAQKNPALLSNYAIDGKPLSDGYNVIFETERMCTVVSVNDMFIMYKGKSSDNLMAGALQAEQHFTSALLKVTKGSDITAYVTSGHGEAFSAEEFKNNILPAGGYSFKDFAIMTDEIPENADVIIIAAPKTDYSAAEIEKLSAYLSAGGSLQVFTDPTMPELPELETLLGEWGITLGDGLVADDDSAHFAKYRTNIIPDIADNETAQRINVENTQVVFPVSRPVDGANKNDVTVIPIVSTSDSGYIKTDIYSAYDTFEASDIKGKSTVAVMATRPAYDGRAPKIFVSGSQAFLEIRSNKPFYTGLMATMTEQPYSIYIMPKNINQDAVVINQSSIYIYSLFVIVIIPVIILAIGFIIWVKRRHL